jgi:hypothetical protein
MPIKSRQFAFRLTTAKVVLGLWWISCRFGFLHYLGYVIRTGSLAVATVVFDDVNHYIRFILSFGRHTAALAFWERIRYLLW